MRVAKDVVAADEEVFEGLAVDFFRGFHHRVAAERGDLDDFAAAEETMCARRKRRPMIRQLRKRARTSSGRALVAMSKSFGLPPRSRSRTQPPTR